MVSIAQFQVISTWVYKRQRAPTYLDLLLALRDLRVQHRNHGGQGVAAQVEFESKVCKRTIICELQALKPSSVDPRSTWGRPGMHLHRLTRALAPTRARVSTEAQRSPKRSDCTVSAACACSCAAATSTSFLQGHTGLGTVDQLSVITMQILRLFICQWDRHTNRNLGCQSWRDLVVGQL